MVRFVCNNFWQTLADHHVDLPHETKHLYTPKAFVPEQVQEGHVVFVKTDLLDVFVMRLLPRIGCRFVLITGHSDLSPSHEAMAVLHADPRVLRWYCPNGSWTDFKTVPIPLGLSEPDRPIGDQHIVAQCMETVGPKERKVWFPASAPTHPAREVLKDITHPMMTRSDSRLSFKDYLTTLGKYQFVLCPRGNGRDVHRVHEAILMRTVPIYFTDHAPALFKHLPVIVVQSLPDLHKVLDNLDNWTFDADWEQAQKYLMVDDVPHVYNINNPRVLRRE
jgi:hypothetical protein